MGVILLCFGGVMFVLSGIALRMRSSAHVRQSASEEALSIAHFTRGQMCFFAAFFAAIAALFIATGATHLPP